MARATRSSKPAASKAKNSEPEAESKSLSPVDTNPPKLFVLPKDASPEARIVTLDEPATAAPSRYFYCPEKGLFEFTRIAAPKTEPRSWLVTDDNVNGDERTEETTKEAKLGYVARSPDLFVATPIDPVFFALPIVATDAASKKSRKSMLLSLDDHIDTAPRVAKHFKHLLRRPDFRSRIESRLRAVCDFVDAGDDSMFRLSVEKLEALLLSKAESLMKHGLPASLEERFVSRPLQAPLVTVRREEMTVATEETSTKVAEDTTLALEGESQSTTTSSTSIGQSTESQDSVATSITTVVSVTVEAEAVPTVTATTDTVRDLLRLRTALDFILRSYIAPSVREMIRERVQTSKRVDFAPLDVHLKQLDALRAEAHALRTISDNISRKRTAEDDDVAGERAEKKRKKEEEEKKRKAESRGVKELRKVNTNGMKKLSSFFTKVPKKA
jgi:hypothetical protein